MKNITKEAREAIVMLLFIFVSVVLTFILYKGNFYFYLDSNIYQIFHVTIETINNITAASIFMLLHYLYPSENKAKYIISGSLFLSMVMVNTMHIYFSFIGHPVYRVYTSNLVHLITAIIVLLFSVVPDKSVIRKKLTITIIPVGFILVNILLSLFNEDLYMYFFTPRYIFTGNNNYLQLTLSLFYLYSLISIIKEYEKNKSVIYSSLIYGMVFFIYSWVFVFLVKSPTDMYSVLSQFLKFAGIVFTFRAYYVNSIKKPFEELRYAKKIAEEASSIKTDFIVNLSHELRTPVNVIFSALRMMDGKDKNAKYIRSIEKNAHRLNKVCENIILFNEIENGAIDVNPSETDIIYMIDEILEEADIIADEKNLDITFNFGLRSAVLIDRNKIKTILLNLISNAIKYVPHNGMVDISLDMEECLKLVILNNGPVIQEEDRIRLFDKFFKSTDSNLCSREGLGIGLYISKIYAESMGGTIEIINNDGLTGYKLTLPIERLPDQPVVENDYSITGYFADIS